MQRTPTGAAWRAYSRAELRADRAIHVVGVAAAATAVPVLLFWSVRWHGASPIAAAALVYGATLLAMLGLSAAFNLSERPDLCDWLRRGDHAAIYAKIAGTYTPLAVLHGGAWTLPILGLVWSGACAGMVLKLAWPRRSEGFGVLLYLGIGWSVVVVGPVVQGLSPTAFALIATGGILYTVGVPFYLCQQLPFQTAIWHGFVLCATALLFAAIAIELATERACVDVMAGACSRTPRPGAVELSAPIGHNPL